jgi:hypothetical protein
MFDSRRLYLVVGDYQKREKPSKDYVSVEYHGFDSMYSGVIVCNNNSYTVYYAYGYYESDSLSQKIKCIRIDYDSLSVLTENKNNYYITGY